MERAAFGLERLISGRPVHEQIGRTKAGEICFFSADCMDTARILSKIHPMEPAIIATIIGAVVVLILLSLPTMWWYHQSLKRHEPLQNRAEGQLERHEKLFASQVQHVERYEKLLSRAERLMDRLEKSRGLLKDQHKIDPLPHYGRSSSSSRGSTCSASKP